MNTRPIDPSPSARTTEVYFEGRVSAVVLVPALLWAVLWIGLALAAFRVLDLELRLLYPGAWLAEIRANGVTLSALLGPAADLVILAALVSFLRRYLRWRSRHYRISSDRVEIERGMFARSVRNLELWRIRDIRYRRTFLQALLGLGTIKIFAADDDVSAAQIGPIRRSKRIYDNLKRARLKAGRAAGAQATGMVLPGPPPEGY